MQDYNFDSSNVIVLEWSGSEQPTRAPFVELDEIHVSCSALTAARRRLQLVGLGDGGRGRGRGQAGVGAGAGAGAGTGAGAGAGTDTEAEAGMGVEGAAGRCVGVLAALLAPPCCLSPFVPRADGRGRAEAGVDSD